jgi:cystathionine beta-lyase/cystathionine gamma-synthase
LALADLEGCEEALCFSSGMGAISATLTGLLEEGDRVIADGVLYGGTYSFLKDHLPRRGVEVTFADTTDPAEVRNVMDERTRMVYTETISNPLMAVPDLKALAEICHENNTLLAVDSTFASPWLCRPAHWGADIVLHSATKYLNGHSDVTGGIVTGPARLVDRIRPVRSILGSSMSPFDAWLVLRGIRTLHLRMAAHCRNALSIARWLEKQKGVLKVHYPGLENHPGYGRARRQFGEHSGGMLSFELQGGLKSASSFIAGLKLVEMAPSLAALATTVSHPGKTSHRSVPVEVRQEKGIGEGLIRLSAGIDAAEDVIADLKQALESTFNG